MERLIIGRFPTLTLLLNGFYKQLRHNLHVQYDAVDLMQTSMTSWNIAAALL